MEQGIYQFIFIMMIVFTVLQLLTYRNADKKERRWKNVFIPIYIVLAIWAGYLAFS